MKTESKTKTGHLGNTIMKLTRWVKMSALLTTIALAVMGCRSGGHGMTRHEMALVRGPGTPNYSTNLLQEGDVVNVSFRYSTNLNSVQKIGLDGFLNLEEAGKIKAAGKTPNDLQTEINALYKPTAGDDIVTVRVVSAATSVYVFGAVFRPGKLMMDRPMTVLEAVIEAGGFDPNRAKIADVVVLRVESGFQRIYHFNLRRVLEGMEEPVFYLRPFDVVHVPAKAFNF